MKTHLRSHDLMKHPTAWLPLLMSLCALLLFLSYLWISTPAPQSSGDEGAPARVYQMLMSLQIPVLLLFPVLWWKREPRKTLLVLALQVVAWIAAFLPVLLIEM